MNARLHHKTPTINAYDSRGLPVRQVAYYRHNAQEQSQARITLQEHDTAGRLVARRDPRLATSASAVNLQIVYSLSGKTLWVDSVDAGWRLNLPGDAGQILHSWDQRGTRRQTTYDTQLRMTEIHEQAEGEEPRRVECLQYGDSSPESARHNLCGVLIRHDDSAGSLLTHDHSLCAKPLSQTRHLLAKAGQPDWPEDQKDRDRLLEKGGSYMTNWRYDALARIIQLSDAAQHQQLYSFDVAGQLKSVSLKIKDDTTEKTVLKHLAYNAFGQVESQTAGNGIVTRAVFDPASGRLASLSTSAPGRSLQDLHYIYDPVGNVTQVEDRAQPVRFGNNQRVTATSTFTYDSLYQLTRATGREAAGLASPPTLGMPAADDGQLFNYTEHYAYDAGGNLTELRHVREGNNYTRTLNIAAQSNRLQSWNKGQSASDTVVNFDVSGNQQALAPGQVLTWNTRNQLQSVVLVQRDNAANDIERYCYDSGGQRVRKVHTTHAPAIMHTREVRYLPGLEIHTRHNERLEVVTLQAGRCSVRYLHWTQGRPAAIAANQMRYSLEDHLGSSSLELDDQSDLISQESYLPYGGTAWVASRSEVEADYRTVRYSGKERDASGLYYYGQRYYAPWLQRWINPDPAGTVDGLNLYCMVGNNPLRYVDRSGRNKEEAAIQQEIAAYPNILSTVNNRVGVLNYQIYNSFSTKDITKRLFQAYAYNASKNLVSLGAGMVAAPAGLVASWAAMSGTSITTDAIANKLEATRHLPVSIYPQTSRLDPDEIEHEGRTAFYDVKTKSEKAIKDLNPRHPTGQKKIALMVTSFILTKVLRIPGAWIPNFEASTQATKASNGIPSQKIRRLDAALLELDDHLQHDSTAIDAAFDTLGVEEFYAKGVRGSLNQSLDWMTNSTGTAGARTLSRGEIQRQIHATRATIQHGRELLFRLNEHNKSLGRLSP
ncbi:MULTISPECIES: RHS repeat domain-containing protein [unclassified Pseudomonas]|uniref:RHS repeat domain-containing protein n=1 Tax=unclassified Pseudomonas TaxID=196821 RepID=UPI00119C49AC|nr:MULTISPECIES: RHS repeat-associated core domain-containing protein [unclassified Pseudomonas]TWC11384.1 RHS repeat-associated protein [Pseudomonas sp. SJZ075]TWC13331.1 RHS repeat-associated protein [Pseudomonas sp. SJZ074]TWC28060.1 RHS repeat-associated protein [Pseudomonas sp. SJZ078]TWC31785.1 RHS repeat-associated protein [Pseudomonas sp. SJZ085]TWC47731.1 RHS repeat-associated protein [Pseudomonas sp. SJZ124]